MIVKRFLLKAIGKSKPNLPGSSQYREEEHPRAPGGEWTDKLIKKKEEKTFKMVGNEDDFLYAVNNTEGAKILKDGIELDISRYQKPEQFKEN